MQSFPLKGNKASGKKAAEEFSFFMKEKQTHFPESSDSDIKKLVATFPVNTRKTAKYAVNVFEGEKHKRADLKLSHFIEWRI